MRIFVTGAPGFIGSAVVPELIKAGHQVLGLTRSEAGAEKLRAAGAEVLHGNIEDLDSLRKGTESADGVIHLAFNHDWSQREKNAADERKAITALGEALVGSNRPLLVTSGTALAVCVDGQPSTEASPISSWNARSHLETVLQEFTGRGVTTIIVRLPQVHDTRKQGIVPYITAVAREKRVSAYVGDGSQRWPAAHVSDVARLYRLAFEKAEPGAIYHAVDEEGVSVKRIAEALGRGFNIPVISIEPEQAGEHFGMFGPLVMLDMPSSSAFTRQTLNWTPTGPGLITDLDNMDYTQP